jgi:hypothetical protein
LLENPPSKAAFENFPLLYAQKNKIKFDTGSLNGMITARVGDTLKFKLELLSDVTGKGLYISCIDEFDNKGARIPRSKTLAGQAFHKEGNKLAYTYRVRSKKASLLYLAYGSEYVAVYKLQVE